MVKCPGPFSDRTKSSSAAVASSAPVNCVSSFIITCSTAFGIVAIRANPASPHLN